MVKLPRPPRSGCPINFGLEIFGDRWTLLILRDALLLGKKTFGSFQDSDEGIASNILAERLGRLEECGLLSAAVSAQDARLREYTPTEAARRLIPVLVEMSYWGAKHDRRTAAPKAFVEAYEKDRDALIALISNGLDPTKSR